MTTEQKIEQEIRNKQSMKVLDMLIDLVDDNIGNHLVILEAWI
ncbi:MAG: hypothetical protein Solivirus3_11 [Solivirus sp.]|uniref:Uncharacterized protein n=1 Tax=Solivirus sp. TaxID=2487772 RepID=A0A3G5AI83_9VIRU|nr:MAG: hypothetical protein Solivirus3_11 [Solivirus sp.]